MVAYYEALGAQPAAHLLPQMAEALGVGVLLGKSAPRRVKKTGNSRLQRRLQQIEKLPPRRSVRSHRSLTPSLSTGRSSAR